MATATPEGSPSVGQKTDVRLALAWVLLPLFFLVTGGSLGWWQAWVYCVLLLVPMTYFITRTAQKDPEFLDRRFTFRERERTQRRLTSWSVPVTVAVWVLPGLDRRFGWSHTPTAAVVAAEVLVLASYLGVLRVFTVNRWAGRTVEIRQGQELISTGPYAIVRHPMYVAILVLWLASPVALGSWWALAPAVLYLPVIVVRILNEEEVLVRDLPGYEEYQQRVRYRLLPFVW